MPSCLITGASGLIGSHLVPYLLSQGWQVYGVYRTPSGIPEKAGLHWIKADLSTPFFTAHFPKEIDAVVHLAQSPHFREFPTQANHIYAVNTSATQTLLDYARSANAKHFVLASTGGIYGLSQHAVKEEEDGQCLPFSPDTGFYATSKYCAELLTQNYKAYLTPVILRFFFVYGPGQNQTMLIPRLVQNILDQKLIQLQGAHGLKMNPIFVEDAIQAISQALTLEQSNTFNVAGPEIISLRQAGKTIGRIYGLNPCFEQVSEAEPAHLIADIQKMKQWLRSPQIAFEEGIAKSRKTASLVL